MRKSKNVHIKPFRRSYGILRHCLHDIDGWICVITYERECATHDLIECEKAGVCTTGMYDIFIWICGYEAK